MRSIRFPLTLTRLFCMAMFAATAASNLFAIALDGTFGTGGRVTVPFAFSGTHTSFGHKVFVQPSGRVIVAGSHRQEGGNGQTNGVAVAGLTSAGALDASFGANGKILDWNATDSNSYTDAEMLPDGRFLVLKQLLQLSGANRPVLTRYTANGQTDPAFSADLDVVAGLTLAGLVELGSGGKIYVLVKQANADNFFLVRLNSDGSRDPSFGPAGVLPISFRRMPGRQISGVHELAGGKILVTGTTGPDLFGMQDVFAARYNSDLNLDRGYGRQGVVRVGGEYENPSSLTSVVQPDGKLLVGGFVVFLGSDAMLMRFDHRGRPDLDFGDRGAVRSSFGNLNGFFGLVLTPEGKIVAVGSSGAKALPSLSKFLVARYSSRGLLESHLLHDFTPGSDATARSVSLQQDGKILAAGYTPNPASTTGGSYFAAARYMP